VESSGRNNIVRAHSTIVLISLSERNVSNNFVYNVVGSYRYTVLNDSIKVSPIENDVIMECGVKV